MSTCVQKQKSSIFSNFNNLQKHQSSIFRQLATKIESATLTIDIFLNQSQVQDVRWIKDENELREKNDQHNIQKQTIQLNEMYTSQMVTKSFLNNLNDSFEKLITNQVINGINQLEMKSFLYGNGENEPQGIINHPKARVIEFTDVITTLMTMLTKIDSFYHDNLVWLVNRTFLSNLMNIKNSAITNIISYCDNKLSILGIPVHTIDHLEQEHMAILINIEQSYCIADHVSGVDTLVDHFSKKPYVEFYFVKYTGGLVLNNESYIVCSQKQE